MPGEVAVQRHGFDELGVRPLPDDLAAVEYDDEVAVDDGRQPVRDHHERPPGRHGVDRLPHPLLVEAVERRRRLVQQQNRGSGQQRPRDREPLALAARQHHAGFADGCLQAER